MISTVPRGASESALLVGMDVDLDGICTVVLRGTGLKVLRAAHIEAACERIPVVRPLVVVVDARVERRDRERLEDRTVAVGAETVWIEEDVDRDELVRLLTAAVVAATERAERVALP